MSEEVSPEVIKKTQKILSRYINKPPLTEKLLKKPPFRFLHDVVHSIIKQTGFLKGLYAEEELQSEKIKDKDAKVAFLNKLIEAVKVITKAQLSVRASKIVAGLEPTNTNLLLQALGKALESKLSSEEYVEQLKSGQAAQPTDTKQSQKTAETKHARSKTKEREKDAAKASKSKQSVESTRDSKRTKVKESPRTVVKESPRNKDKESPRSKEKTKKSSSRQKESARKVTEKNEANVVNEINDVEDSAKDLKIEADEGTNAVKEIEQTIVEDPKDEVVSTKAQESKENIQEDTGESVSKASLVRPKSARPKSGEKEKLSEKQALSTKEELMKPLEMTVKQPSQRPKSSLRPPSVRPSSARPGAPRLRPDSALPLQESVLMGNINVIVENVDVADEEETVVVENAAEVTEDAVEMTEIALKNKGHLVEQILEKLQEGDQSRTGLEIEWEPSAVNKDGAKELSQLRVFIQNTTKTANPLGKLMNYLHEDIDAMHGELQMWTHTKKQLFSEIEKQKRVSTESNRPLLAQLEQLQQDIDKYKHEIVDVQSNILRNDQRIKELLSK